MTTKFAPTDPGSQWRLPSRVTADDRTPRTGHAIFKSPGILQRIGRIYLNLINDAALTIHLPSIPRRHRRRQL
ncbi:hypothetical protein RRG08_014677 [Elysia crispata]|uniref:Uncharacterized protein n=1 Tax=Elysia crispata TaxID=231223 RepID=A0AAE0YI45_9GAST|nr:hypothetical protein RRG08_014677 [Elysia crispata]